MKSFTSSPRAYIAAVIGLLAVVHRPESAHALQVMISYPNSTCADDGLTISGTYQLSYDEYAYADEGFSVDYYGTCMYFEGGYFNLSAVDEYVDPSDYIQTGVCSQCSSDLAICLGPYDDATTACSEVKQQYQSNVYQSTLASLQQQQQKQQYQSNAYQSTLGGSTSSSSSSSLATDPVMQFSLATRQIHAGCPHLSGNTSESSNIGGEEATAKVPFRDNGGAVAEIARDGENSCGVMINVVYL